MFIRVIHAVQVKLSESVSERPQGKIGATWLMRNVLTFSLPSFIRFFPPIATGTEDG